MAMLHRLLGGDAIITHPIEPARVAVPAATWSSDAFVAHARTRGVQPHSLPNSPSASTSLAPSGSASARRRTRAVLNRR